LPKLDDALRKDDGSRAEAGRQDKACRKRQREAGPARIAARAWYRKTTLRRSIAGE
jgi:hypothetical protein